MAYCRQESGEQCRRTSRSSSYCQRQTALRWSGRRRQRLRQSNQSDSTMTSRSTTHRHTRLIESLINAAAVPRSYPARLGGKFVAASTVAPPLLISMSTLRRRIRLISSARRPLFSKYFYASSASRGLFNARDTNIGGHDWFNSWAKMIFRQEWTPPPRSMSREQIRRILAKYAVFPKLNRFSIFSLADSLVKLQYKVIIRHPITLFHMRLRCCTTLWNINQKMSDIRKLM